MAAKKLITAIKTPRRNTYWKPKVFQISPPSRATEIEKMWSMVTEAVSAGWMSSGLQGDLLHVGGAGHADRHEHLIQQVADADDQEGGVLGEHEPGEAVSQADKHQQHGFRTQDEALAQAVDHPAQQRLEEDADDPAQGQQRGHGLGGLLEDGHHHPGGEGDEQLFARAVQHGQDVVQPVLAVQLQEGLRLVDLLPSAWRTGGLPRRQAHRCQDKRSAGRQTPGT